MRKLFKHFDRVHLFMFLGFYFAFAALTFFVLSSGTQSGQNKNSAVIAALGAISGPFAGAIARGFQACCWKFSVSILSYCALFLGLGLFFQLVPLKVKCVRDLRLAFWGLGLLSWFGGVVVSFGHSLS